MDTKVFYDQMIVDSTIAHAMKMASLHPNAEPRKIVEMLRQSIESSTVCVSNNYICVRGKFEIEKG